MTEEDGIEKSDTAPQGADSTKSKKDEDRIDTTPAIPRVVDLTQPQDQVPIIVTTTLVGSGRFIEMYESGITAKVSPLVTEHHKIGERLAVVEAKLRACNEAHTLAEFEQYCRTKSKEFPAALRKLAGELEQKKVKLRKRLQRICAQVSDEEPALAESMKSRIYVLQGPVSLVPTRLAASDPEIEARDKFIAAHGRGKGIDICRQLDLQFLARSGEPARTLPEGWVEDHGVKTFIEAYEDDECKGRVQSLISKAKRKYSYLQI